ncbi:MAG: hypothetical protein LBV27_04520, partial [Oscillospiraceae bacterium]|nr:hypothetical protein [Oscillospiraceae bacterium]
KLSGADVDKLVDIIGDIPDDCMLVLTGKAAFDPKSAGAKKIIKATEAAGSVVELGARTQQGLAAFLKSQAGQNGCMLPTDLANRMITACGPDMNTLRCEIAKVCARAGYGAITAEHIDDVVIPRTEARVFDLSKMILAGNTKRAMDILNDLFYLREQPIAILSTLIMAYVDLYRARVARACGAQQSDVVERFSYKGREFRVRNAFNARLDTQALRRCLDALYDCDRKMKSTGVDDKVLLEQTVVRLFMAAA